MSEPKRLSEKDVAEIRARYDRHPAVPGQVDQTIIDVTKLLADRDAHLADLKEARELIDIYRRQHCVRGIDNPELRCNCCRNADALLERTK